jgi:hypothetical protein
MTVTTQPCSLAVIVAGLFLAGGTAIALNETYDGENAPPPVATADLSPLEPWVPANRSGEAAAAAEPDSDTPAAVAPNWDPTAYCEVYPIVCFP